MVEADCDQVYQLLSCAGMGLNLDSKEGIAQFLKRNPQTWSGSSRKSATIGAILVGFDGRRAYIFTIQLLIIRITVGDGLLDSWLKTVLTVLDELKIFIRLPWLPLKRLWEKLGFSRSRRSHLPHQASDWNGSADTGRRTNKNINHLE